MINPQLVEYYTAQLKLGAGKNEIKDALLNAGWSAADVEDSINGAETPPQKITPPREITEAQKAGATISVSDLVPSSQFTVASVAAAATRAPTRDADKAGSEKKSLAMPKLHASSLLPVILGVVAVICAGGAIYFYIQNRGLQDKLSALGVGSDATNAKVADLNSQIANLNKSLDGLKSQISSLNGKNAELLQDLSFFAAPASSGTAALGAAAVNFKGMVSGGKAQYALVNADGVKIVVANSKDVKVDAALKPLVGQDAEIQGTHNPGSNSVTVVSVNGASVE